MDYTLITLITLIGFISGIVGPLTGSGGLIIMPTMILLGVPPQNAIAASRFSSLGLWGMALRKYMQAGKVNWDFVPGLCLLAILGGAGGAFLTIATPNEILQQIIAVVLILVVLFVAVKKDLGIVQLARSKPHIVLGFFLYALMAIYGGFIGAGGGIAVRFIFLAMFGMTVIQASATDTLPWLFSAAISSAIFFFNGLLDLSIALPLFVSMAIGGHVGAHIVVKKGDAWVKRVYVTVSLLMALKLLWDAV